MSQLLGEFSQPLDGEDALMESRRKFLKVLVSGSAGFWITSRFCPIASAQTRFKNLSTPLVEIPNRWWKPLPNNRLQCFICPFT
ncbi:MAG: hypothetical protein RMK89_12455 [Armatimonadota bacterium]|nr:hypothetical protein [Armatimonadota bacterium]MDW8144260.1 hypothetical protein [Armatimonadota bacterium]